MSTTSLRRRRIVRLSAVMAVVCALMVPVGPFALFFFALLAPINTLIGIAGLSPLNAAGVAAAEAARLPFGVVALTSALPLSFGLIRLAACFRGFAREELFSPATIAGLRDFAGAILFWSLTQPLFGAAISVILTMGAPEGQRHLAVQVSSNFVLMSVFALCVLVVSWVLSEASALSDENAQFV